MEQVLVFMFRRKVNLYYSSSKYSSKFHLEKMSDAEKNHILKTLHEESQLTKTNKQDKPWSFL